jgi:hypothetical protein
VTSDVELDELGTEVGVELVEVVDVVEVVELLELVVADEALCDEHAPRHNPADAKTNTKTA